MKNLIDEKKFKKVKHDAIEKFITKCKVDVTKIQEALDMSRVSRKGYASIFSIFSCIFKELMDKMCVVTHTSSSVAAKRSSKPRNRR